MKTFLDKDYDLPKYDNDGLIGNYAGADCRDTSNFLHILGKTLGISSNIKRIVPSSNAFITKYIKATEDCDIEGNWQEADILKPTYVLSNLLPYYIFSSPSDLDGSGSPPSNPRPDFDYHDWVQAIWGYHQIVIFDDDLYDSCLKIDSNPPSINPIGYINELAIWQDEAVFINGIYGALYGFINYSGIYSPITPTQPVGLIDTQYKGYLVHDGVTSFTDYAEPMISISPAP